MTYVASFIDKKQEKRDLEPMVRKHSEDRHLGVYKMLKGRKSRTFQLIFVYGHGRRSPQPTRIQILYIHIIQHCIVIENLHKTCFQDSLLKRRHLKVFSIKAPSKTTNRSLMAMKSF